MDMNIEENILKHQNVNIPTEYNISLYTFLDAMHQNMLFCNEFHFSCKNAF